MQNAVKRRPLLLGIDKDFLQPYPVRDLAFHKRDACRQKLLPAVAQVVKNDRLVSLFGKQTRNCTTYVPGTSGN